MPRQSRRNVLKMGIGVATSTLMGKVRRSIGADSSRRFPFTMDLRCGSIGVDADQVTAIRLADENGFESVAPDVNYLANLSEASLSQILDRLQKADLVWGAGNMPVEFRGDETAYRNSLAHLPKLAAGMQRAGVTRTGTWISPVHRELTYLTNFRQHVRRLRECAKILADNDVRFGLEYVGTKTLWTSRQHSFVHTMAETKELLAEIDQPNMGFVLDSWHWYTAHETIDDLLTLRNEQIVACDLNDAPRRIPIDQQIDSRRELPAATGVIDLAGFLGALVQLRYDGPIRAEPFNQDLNNLDNEAAVAKTAGAMRAAFALIES